MLYSQYANWNLKIWVVLEHVKVACQGVASWLFLVCCYLVAGVFAMVWILTGPNQKSLHISVTLWSLDMALLSSFNASLHIINCYPFYHLPFTGKNSDCLESMSTMRYHSCLTHKKCCENYMLGIMELKIYIWNRDFWTQGQKNYIS